MPPPAPIRSSHPPHLTQSPFLLIACQGGAEQALQQRQQRWFPAWRQTAWRRGVVSFRLPDTTLHEPAWRNRAIPAEVADQLVFGQTMVRCLGQVTGSTMTERVTAAAERTAVTSFADVHVWNRDLRLDSDPEAIRDALAQAHGVPAQPSAAGASSRVLDCIVDTADRWWIGWHQLQEAADHWPGGRYPGHLPPDAVSRAWLKLDEAISRFDLTFTPGQRACEFGASPGGACQRLLAAGLQVIGVDPATIDRRVTDHPQFTHWQKRARDVRLKDLRGCDWLVTDMNIDPTSTIAALERVLATPGRRPQGVIATLKLPDWSRAEALDDWLARFATWGYQPRVRQLATGGREVCLVARLASGR